MDVVISLSPIAGDDPHKIDFDKESSMRLFTIKAGPCSVRHFLVGALLIGDSVIPLQAVPLRVADQHDSISKHGKDLSPLAALEAGGEAPCVYGARLNEQGEPCKWIKFVSSDGTVNKDEMKKLLINEEGDESWTLSRRGLKGSNALALAVLGGSVLASAAMIRKVSHMGVLPRRMRAFLGMTDEPSPAQKDPIVWHTTQEELKKLKEIAAKKEKEEEQALAAAAAPPADTTHAATVSTTSSMVDKKEEKDSSQLVKRSTFSETYSHVEFDPDDNVPKIAKKDRRSPPSMSRRCKGVGKNKIFDLFLSSLAAAGLVRCNVIPIVEIRLPLQFGQEQATLSDDLLSRPKLVSSSSMLKSLQPLPFHMIWTGGDEILSASKPVLYFDSSDKQSISLPSMRQEPLNEVKIDTNRLVSQSPLQDLSKALLIHNAENSQLPHSGEYLEEYHLTKREPAFTGSQVAKTSAAAAVAAYLTRAWYNPSQYEKRDFKIESNDDSLMMKRAGGKLWSTPKTIAAIGTSAALGWLVQVSGHEKPEIVQQPGMGYVKRAANLSGNKDSSLIGRRSDPNTFIHQNVLVSDSDDGQHIKVITDSGKEIVYDKHNGNNLDREPTKDELQNGHFSTDDSDKDDPVVHHNIHKSLREKVAKVLHLEPDAKTSVQSNSASSKMHSKRVASWQVLFIAIVTFTLFAVSTSATAIPAEQRLEKRSPMPVFDGLTSYPAPLVSNLSPSLKTVGPSSNIAHVEGLYKQPKHYYPRPLSPAELKIYKEWIDPVSGKLIKLSDDGNFEYNKKKKRQGKSRKLMYLDQSPEQSPPGVGPQKSLHFGEEAAPVPTTDDSRNGLGGPRGGGTVVESKPPGNEFGGEGGGSIGGNGGHTNHPTADLTPTVQPTSHQSPQSPPSQQFLPPTKDLSWRPPVNNDLGRKLALGGGIAGLVSTAALGTAAYLNRDKLNQMVANWKGGKVSSEINPVSLPGEEMESVHNVGHVTISSPLFTGHGKSKRDLSSLNNVDLSKQLFPLSTPPSDHFVSRRLVKRAPLDSQVVSAIHNPIGSHSTYNAPAQVHLSAHENFATHRDRPHGVDVVVDDPGMAPTRGIASFSDKFIANTILADSQHRLLQHSSRRRVISRKVLLGNQRPSFIEKPNTAATAPSTTLAISEPGGDIDTSLSRFGKITAKGLEIVGASALTCGAFCTGQYLGRKFLNWRNGTDGTPSKRELSDDGLAEDSSTSPTIVDGHSLFKEQRIDGKLAAAKHSNMVENRAASSSGSILKKRALLPDLSDSLAPASQVSAAAYEMPLSLSNTGRRISIPPESSIRHSHIPRRLLLDGPSKLPELTGEALQVSKMYQSPEFQNQVLLKVQEAAAAAQSKQANSPRESFKHAAATRTPSKLGEQKTVKIEEGLAISLFGLVCAVSGVGLYLKCKLDHEQGRRDMTVTPLPPVESQDAAPAKRDLSIASLDKSILPSGTFQGRQRAMEEVQRHLDFSLMEHKGKGHVLRKRSPLVEPVTGLAPLNEPVVSSSTIHDIVLSDTGNTRLSFPRYSHAAAKSSSLFELPKMTNEALEVSKMYQSTEFQDQLSLKLQKAEDLKRKGKISRKLQDQNLPTESLDPIKTPSSSHGQVSNTQERIALGTLSGLCIIAGGITGYECHKLSRERRRRETNVVPIEIQIRPPVKRDFTTIKSLDKSILTDGQTLFQESHQSHSAEHVLRRRSPLPEPVTNLVALDEPMASSAASHNIVLSITGNSLFSRHTNSVHRLDTPSVNKLPEMKGETLMISKTYQSPEFQHRLSELQKIHDSKLKNSGQREQPYRAARKGHVKSSSTEHDKGNRRLLAKVASVEQASAPTRGQVGFQKNIPLLSKLQSAQTPQVATQVEPNQGSTDGVLKDRSIFFGTAALIASAIAGGLYGWNKVQEARARDADMEIGGPSQIYPLKRSLSGNLAKEKLWSLDVSSGGSLFLDQPKHRFTRLPHLIKQHALLSQDQVEQYRLVKRSPEVTLSLAAFFQGQQRQTLVKRSPVQISNLAIMEVPPLAKSNQITTLSPLSSNVHFSEFNNLVTKTNIAKFVPEEASEEAAAALKGEALKVSEMFQSPEFHDQINKLQRIQDGDTTESNRRMLKGSSSSSSRGTGTPYYYRDSPGEDFDEKGAWHGKNAFNMKKGNTAVQWLKFFTYVAAIGSTGACIYGACKAHKSAKKAMKKANDLIRNLPNKTNEWWKGKGEEKLPKDQFLLQSSKKAGLHIKKKEISNSISGEQIHDRFCKASGRCNLFRDKQETSILGKGESILRKRNLPMVLDSAAPILSTTSRSQISGHSLLPPNIINIPNHNNLVTHTNIARVMAKPLPFPPIKGETLEFYKAVNAPLYDNNRRLLRVSSGGGFKFPRIKWPHFGKHKRRSKAKGTGDDKKAPPPPFQTGGIYDPDGGKTKESKDHGPPAPPKVGGWHGSRAFQPNKGNAGQRFLKTIMYLGPTGGITAGSIYGYRKRQQIKYKIQAICNRISDAMKNLKEKFSDHAPSLPQQESTQHHRNDMSHYDIERAGREERLARHDYEEEAAYNDYPPPWFLERREGPAPIRSHIHRGITKRDIQDSSFEDQVENVWSAIHPRPSSSSLMSKQTWDLTLSVLPLLSFGFLLTIGSLWCTLNWAKHPQITNHIFQSLSDSKRQSTIAAHRSALLVMPLATTLAFVSSGILYASIQSFQHRAAPLPLFTFSTDQVDNTSLSKSTLERRGGIMEKAVVSGTSAVAAGAGFFAIKTLLDGGNDSNEKETLSGIE